MGQISSALCLVFCIVCTLKRRIGSIGSLRETRCNEMWWGLLDCSQIFYMTIDFGQTALQK
jgi:hypothetical protein